MALFRKKKAQDEEGSEPQALSEQLAKLSVEELLAAPEVRHQRREVAKMMENRTNMVNRHLEVVHQPGGLAAIRQSADFMDMGAARPYLDALSDLSIAIEAQVMGNDITTLWTVNGTHTGELCGVPPTGGPVTLRGVTMSVIKEGVIATEFTYWDFPPFTERLRSPTPS